MQAFHKVPWRRRLRLSVRVLMCVVLIVGCGLGWVVRRARVQREAVAEIERAGGGVLYAWQFRNGIPNPAGKPWAPRWLIDLIGVDHIGSVVYVAARTRKTSDPVLAAIGRLGRLERLDLADSAVTDAALVHLEGLSRLETLELGGTEIGDAGVAHLKALTGLRELYLQPSRVGDAGLAHLERLRELRVLYLGGSRVTDAGLSHLKSMTGLQVLTLWGTRVTDAGLRHLEGLTRLELLAVGELGGITEAGVKRFERALPKVDIER